MTKAHRKQLKAQYRAMTNPVAAPGQENSAADWLHENGAFLAVVWTIILIVIGVLRH